MLQLIGIIVIKRKQGLSSKPTNILVGIYSVIPIIQPCQDELEIKCPLEYLQMLVTTLVSLLYKHKEKFVILQDIGII